MANKVPLSSVIVVRDGKRVSPPIGKAFPFNDDEIKAMKAGVHYRDAVNEDQEASEAELVGIRPSSHIKAKTNGQGAGNTTAMASGFDGTAATGGQSGQSADMNTDPRLAGTIDDLKGRLAEIDDKAELGSILAAEKAAQNRSGAITAINARLSALTTDDDL